MIRPVLRRPVTALVTALAAVLVLTAAPTAGLAAVPTNATGPTGRPPLSEAARVDAVPTPRLAWSACGGRNQCATVRLPLDYDHPRGRTVQVALLKVPAADPARRIGSLFLNPGGPGGSGKDIAVRAADFLSPTVLDRFDLIGMDPRGTNDSTRVQCYPDEAAQAVDTDVFGLAFPLGARQEAAYRQAAVHLATTCSTAGRPLSAAMSTAEVARDLDVLRRAVGDRRLTYLGWSYGTYLGQVYASLFPDRVRAVAIDGVVDAVAWRGTPATDDLPVTMRLNSAAGASRALTTVLRRCRRAGVPRCPIAPDPAAAFAEVAAALRTHPVTVTDEDGTYEISYAEFVRQVLFALYDPAGAEDVPTIVQVLQQLITPTTSRTTRVRAATRYRMLVAHRSAPREHSSGGGGLAASADALANDYELNAAVACSDSRNPHDPRRWSDLSDRADHRAPYFGRFFLWTSAVCARWTALDEDAYRGRFDVAPAGPVLVVGNYYDPATNYDAAVSVARRLPHSRLLSSDSWGHTAYGTSDCATTTVDTFLLRTTLPARGTVCVGDVQPFATTR